MKVRCTKPKFKFSCKLTAKIDSPAALVALAALFEHAEEAAYLLKKEGRIDEGTAYNLGGVLTALLAPVWERVVELSGSAVTEEAK